MRSVYYSIDFRGDYFFLYAGNISPYCVGASECKTSLSFWLGADADVDNS